MSKIYKVGLIGCGHIAETYFKAHSYFKNFRIIKCADINHLAAKIKSFYMRLNEDGKTVRAMDILFPGIGEIVGGSQREDRLDYLMRKIKEVGIDEKELWWYICLLYTSPSPRDRTRSRMPSSA